MSQEWIEDEEPNNSPVKEEFQQQKTEEFITSPMREQVGELMDETEKLMDILGFGDDDWE